MCGISLEVSRGAGRGLVHYSGWIMDSYMFITPFFLPLYMFAKFHKKKFLKTTLSLYVGYLQVYVHLFLIFVRIHRKLNSIYLWTEGLRGKG